MKKYLVASAAVAASTSAMAIDNTNAELKKPGVVDSILASISKTFSVEKDLTKINELKSTSALISAGKLERPDTPV